MKIVKDNSIDYVVGMINDMNESQKILDSYILLKPNVLLLESTLSKYLKTEHEPLKQSRQVLELRYILERALASSFMDGVRYTK